MAFGLFIAGFGFMYAKHAFGNETVGFLFHHYLVSGIGLLITLTGMFLRSVYDDHGWHIGREELEDKGVKV
ncbi:cytochrome c oxidase subunit 1 [compost metagenome]